MSEFAQLLLQAVAETNGSISDHQSNSSSYGNFLKTNDTKPTPSWLDTLAETASKNPNPMPRFVKLEEPSIESNLTNMFPLSERRPRAMSEPVTSEDTWATTLKIASFNPNLPPINEQLDASPAILPHLNERYASIYNKDGRVGMYTREERNAIIRKYHEKRARRVWSKKIRYSCRKNLADRRIRIKGRFVKGAVGSAPAMDNPSNPSNISMVAGEIIVPGVISSSASKRQTKPTLSSVYIMPTTSTVPSKSQSSSSKPSVVTRATRSSVSPIRENAPQNRNSKVVSIIPESRPRGNTMTTTETYNDTDDTIDDEEDEVITEDDSMAMTGRRTNTSSGVVPTDTMELLANAALAKVSSEGNNRNANHSSSDDMQSDTNDDDLFDEESEEQFLRDFLSGKLSVPYTKRRRHSIA